MGAVGKAKQLSRKLCKETVHSVKVFKSITAGAFTMVLQAKRTILTSHQYQVLYYPEAV